MFYFEFSNFTSEIWALSVVKYDLVIVFSYKTIVYLLICFTEFFVDKFIDVSRKELRWECDYEREAKFTEDFRFLFDF